MNGTDTFLDINNAHLRVNSGNVQASTFVLDQINIVTSANTASTVNFNNVTKAFNAASNIEVGTANLFVDTTTSNVGIGTDAPAYTLDVHGTANVGNLYTTSNVGINTNSPQQTLHINGGTLIGGHVLPTQHEQFDIGSAEAKIRHMFLSDNSLWIGDEAKLSFTGNQLKFRRRKKNAVPRGLVAIGAAQDPELNESTLQTNALAHANKPSVGDMKLEHWLAYAKTLDATKQLSDVFTNQDADYDATSASEAFKEIGNEIYSTHKLRLGSSVAPTATLDITGTAKVSGDVTVDTNTFHIDTTNDSVGIGTTSPQEKLDVAGTAPYLSITDTRTSSGGTAGRDLGGVVFRTKDTTDPSPETGDFLAKIQVTAQNAGSFPDGSLNFFVGDDGDLLSSPSMVIEGVTGNVGVGTADPKSVFHVSGDSSALAIADNTENDCDVNGFQTALVFVDNTWNGSKFYSQNPAAGMGFYLGHLSSSSKEVNMKNLTGELSFGTRNVHQAMYINNDGSVGIGTTSPSHKFDVRNGSGDGVTTFQVKTDGEIRVGRNHALSPYMSTSMGSGRPGINLSSDGGTWTMRKYNNNLDFDWQGSTKGYLLSNGSGQMNFTGQHRTFINGVPFTRADDLEGLIVSANNNEYIKMSGGIETGSNAITVNESLPVVSLSTVADDKKCFGVISASEDPEKREDFFGNFVSITEKENGDTRVYINSVGEGAVWVTNINGPLESGDYITTSNIVGYGQKQNSDSLKNYTVAKITMDCDFHPVTQPIRVIRKEMGNNVLDEHGQLQWIETDETEKAYKIRYLDADGNITDETNAVHIAAFVGCTYHCG